MPPCPPGTPVWQGAGSSLLTSGPWQTELIVPLCLEALPVHFCQAKAQRGCAAVSITFSEGCLASPRRPKSVRVSEGSGPRTSKVFPVISPGVGHTRQGVSSPPPQTHWLPAATQVHVLLLGFLKKSVPEEDMLFIDIRDKGGERREREKKH